MINKRITPQEWGMIIAAIRRIFSRSELRESVVKATKIEHKDTSRGRVKHWSKCPICETPTPTYLIEMDHSDPVIPLEKSGSNMSLDEIVDRIWCDPSNLQPLCKPCHSLKTKAENKIRRQFKKNK